MKQLALPSNKKYTWFITWYGNHGDHYCLHCFHSYKTLNALRNHEKLCENHDYSNVKMSNDDNKYIASTLGKKKFKST